MTPQQVKEIQDALLNRYKLQMMLDKMSPEDLKGVQDYLWGEAIKAGPKIVGQVIDHEYIMGLLPKLEEFQVKNRCPESIHRCFQNVCIKTSPTCSALKLKGNINALADFFERRKFRTMDKSKTLKNYLKYFVERNNLIEAFVLTMKNETIVGYAQSESPKNPKDLLLNAILSKLDPFNNDIAGKTVEIVGSQVLINQQVKMIFFRLKTNNLIIDMEKVRQDLVRIYNDPKLVYTTLKASSGGNNV